MKKPRFMRFWVALSLVAAAIGSASGQSKANRARPGILDASKVEGSLIGIQYENWFVPGQADWETTEAVPLLGKYSSYNADIMKKHFEWFDYLGIDWLLIDWSNMLWMKPAWEEHQGGSRELEKTMDMLFKTCLQLSGKASTRPSWYSCWGCRTGRQWLAASSG